MSATIPERGAQSLSSSVEKCSPSRLLMMAIPWSPIDPDRITLSPGAMFAPEIFTPDGIFPIPAVLMYSLSTLPRLTTLVSPVTICTPASRAVSRIEDKMRLRSDIGNPSSMMNDSERYSGSAPDIARSFVVPQTASLPMSPPGKNMGLTT